MQGDYHRYSAEFADGDARSNSAAKAHQAYQAGMQAAQAIPAAHPIHLGLALNYSVFQHEVLEATDQAVATATEALTKASIDLQNSPQEQKQDAILTMQLIQDNLTLWQ